MVSTGHGCRKGRRAILITLSVSAGLLGLALGLRGSYARFMAEHCRRQLETVPDDRAASLLDEAVRLGEPGIPVLVEALASQRPSVARAAHRALFDEVDRWRSLAARDWSPRLTTLADALAARADRFPNDAQGRDDAARLATQILLWPLDDSQVDRGRVVSCCEKVLRATGASARSAPIHWGLAAPNRSGPHEGGHDEGPRRSGDDPLKTGTPLPGVSDVPGGGLPDDEPATQADAVENSTGRSRTADARAIGPHEPDGPMLEQPRRLLAEPDDAKSILTARGEGGSNQAEKAGDRDSVRPLAYLQAAMGVAGKPAAETPGTHATNKAGTFELIERLGSREAAVAAAARRELERRGFTPRQFEIARQLSDPDPGVRVRLARRLPGLTSIDAVPWLLRLSEDRDAGVRRTAIALLATTGDPAVLSRIERMAEEDPDPAVARQADEIAQRRKAALRRFLLR